MNADELAFWLDRAGRVGLSERELEALLSGARGEEPTRSPLVGFKVTGIKAAADALFLAEKLLGRKPGEGETTLSQDLEAWARSHRYEPHTSIEGVLSNPLTAPLFAAEHAFTNLPYIAPMVAGAVVGAPAAVAAGTAAVGASVAGDILRERMERNNQDPYAGDPALSDYAFAGAGAVVSALADRLLAGKALAQFGQATGGSLGDVATGIARSGLRGMKTEAVGESTEYLASVVNTEQGGTLEELGAAALAGGLVGFGTTAGGRALGEAHAAITGRRAQSQPQAQPQEEGEVRAETVSVEPGAVDPLDAELDETLQQEEQAASEEIHRKRDEAYIRGAMRNQKTRENLDIIRKEPIRGQYEVVDEGPLPPSGELPSPPTAQEPDEQSSPPTAQEPDEQSSPPTAQEPDEQPSPPTAQEPDEQPSPPTAREPGEPTTLPADQVPNQTAKPKPVEKEKPDDAEEMRRIFGDEATTFEEEDVQNVLGSLNEATPDKKRVLRMKTHFQKKAGEFEKLGFGGRAIALAHEAIERIEEVARGRAYRNWERRKDKDELLLRYRNAYDKIAELDREAAARRGESLPTEGRYVGPLETFVRKLEEEYAREYGGVKSAERAKRSIELPPGVHEALRGNWLEAISWREKIRNKFLEARRQVELLAHLKGSARWQKAQRNLEAAEAELRQANAVFVALGRKVGYDKIREALGLRSPEEEEKRAKQRASGLRFDVPRVAITARGTEVPVEYKVVELDKLITSNLHPDMRPNKLYPPELQPRDRTTAVSRDQIRSIAASLDPRRLGFSLSAAEGAPIVDEKLRVVSGNARVLALKEVYSDETLHDQLEEYAWFVRSIDDISSLKKPVLVRVARFSSMEEEVKFAREANERSTAAMSISEQARSDAQAIDPKMARLLKAKGLEAVGNRDFIRVFISTVASNADRSALIGEGGLTRQGLQRVEAALFYYAYRDYDLLKQVLDEPDEELRGLGQALANMSTLWARHRARIIEGRVAPEVDATALLLEAVRAAKDARLKKITPDALVLQQDMFGGGMSDEGKAFLAALINFKGAAPRIKNASQIEGLLARYLEEAERFTPGKDLLGSGPPSPVSILRAIGALSDLPEPIQRFVDGIGRGQPAPEPKAEPETTPEPEPAPEPEAEADEPEDPQLLEEATGLLRYMGVKFPFFVAEPTRRYFIDPSYAKAHGIGKDRTPIEIVFEIARIINPRPHEKYTTAFEALRGNEILAAIRTNSPKNVHVVAQRISSNLEMLEDEIIATLSKNEPLTKKLDRKTIEYYRGLLDAVGTVAEALYGYAYLVSGIDKNYVIDLEKRAAKALVEAEEEAKRTVDAIKHILERPKRLTPTGSRAEQTDLVIEEVLRIAANLSPAHIASVLWTLRKRVEAFAHAAKVPGQVLRNKIVSADRELAEAQRAKSYATTVYNAVMNSLTPDFLIALRKSKVSLSPEEGIKKVAAVYAHLAQEKGAKFAADVVSWLVDAQSQIMGPAQPTPGLAVDALRRLLESDMSPDAVAALRQDVIMANYAHKRESGLVWNAWSRLVAIRDTRTQGALFEAQALSKWLNKRGGLYVSPGDEVYTVDIVLDVARMIVGAINQPTKGGKKGDVVGERDQLAKLSAAQLYAYLAKQYSDNRRARALEEPFAEYSKRIEDRIARPLKALAEVIVRHKLEPGAALVAAIDHGGALTRKVADFGRREARQVLKHLDRFMENIIRSRWMSAPEQVLGDLAALLGVDASSLTVVDLDVSSTSKNAAPNVPPLVRRLAPIFHKAAFPQKDGKVVRVKYVLVPDSVVEQHANKAYRRAAYLRLAWENDGELPVLYLAIPFAQHKNARLGDVIIPLAHEYGHAATVLRLLEMSAADLRLLIDRWLSDLRAMPRSEMARFTNGSFVPEEGAEGQAEVEFDEIYGSSFGEWLAGIWAHHSLNVIVEGASDHDLYAWAKFYDAAAEAYVSRVNKEIGRAGYIISRDVYDQIRVISIYKAKWALEGQDRLPHHMIPPTASVWRLMGKSPRQWPAIQWLADAAKDLRAELTNGSGPGAFRIAMSMIRRTEHGHMHWWTKQVGADIIQKEVLSQLDPSPGTAESAGLGVEEAIEARGNRWLALWTQIVEDAKKDGLSDEDFIDALMHDPSRGALTNVEQKHLDRARKFFDAMWLYMRNAGVEIGYVFSYLPRFISVDKIARDENTQKDFIGRATLIYMGQGDMPDVAEAKAHALYDYLVFGEHKTPFEEPDYGFASIFQERSWEKFAEHVIKSYLDTDPISIGARYVSAAVKRAEWTRRFGWKFSKWHDIEARNRADLRAKGVSPQAIRAYEEGVREYVARLYGVGANHRGWVMAARLKLWATLSMLEKTLTLSLTEPVLTALRSGNVGDAWAALTDTIRILVNKKTREQRLALARDVGLIAGGLVDAQLAQRWMAIDVMSRLQSDIAAAYFRRIGLEQWTNAERAAIAGRGARFLERLALRSDKDSDFMLKELGISDPDAWRAWWRAGGYTADALVSGTKLPRDEFGKKTRDAIYRFTSQIIFSARRGDRPRWANTALGSIVFHLSAYQWAFARNIIMRTARLLQSAKRGEVSRAYIATYMALAFVPTVALYHVLMYLIGEARDRIWGIFDPDPAYERMTTAAKVERAISRTGFTAGYDPILQVVTNTKYEAGLGRILMGPGIGMIADAFGRTANLVVDNTPRTNTAERAWASAMWDLAVEPLAHVMLTGVSHPVAKAMASAGAVLALPNLRAPTIELLAGPRPNRQQRLEGLSEKIGLIQ